MNMCSLINDQGLHSMLYCEHLFKSLLYGKFLSSNSTVTTTNIIKSVKKKEEKYHTVHGFRYLTGFVRFYFFFEFGPAEEIRCVFDDI